MGNISRLFLSETFKGYNLKLTTNLTGMRFFGRKCKNFLNPYTMHNQVSLYLLSAKANAYNYLVEFIKQVLQ